MSSKDAHLYGIPRPKKTASKEITASSTLAFNSALSSLLSGSATSSTSQAPRSRKPLTKSKDDIFTSHNRNIKKRAAADMLAHDDASAKQKSTAGAQIDDASWRRTKRKMEEKARLYAALKRGDVEDESERHMVDFDRKWAENGDEGDEEISSDDSEGEPEELIEYEDEFGRTRKGTRAEVAREQTRRQKGERYLKEADRYAARPNAPSRVIYGDTVQHGAFNPDEPIAVQMEELAKKRDRELTPPEAVHYDADWEVRNKGTGFFQFSKNEEERQRQMQDLEKERQQTENVRAEKDVSVRKEERKKALEERKRLIREKKDKSQANRFLDDLGVELASGEAAPATTDDG